MSYYEDHNGNPRTPTGQFDNTWVVGANQGEQFLAGVGQFDSPYSAQLKVEQARRINGQDPYTGVYLPRDPATGQPYQPGSGGYAGSGGGYSGGGRSARDEGQTLQVLGGVFKAIVLWPIAVAMVFAVVGIGAAAIGRVVEGPGLAAKVARVEFANYQLSPLSARFSAKDLSTPIDPPSLAAALRAHKPDKKADPKQLRAAALMAQAYRCMLQEGCRSGLAKVEPEAAANLPYLAAGFLQPLAAKGDASAARDMCLFAIKLGTGYRDAEISRRNCFQAIYASRQSAPAKEVGSKMDDSWSMKRAEVYAFVGELQALVGL